MPPATQYPSMAAMIGFEQSWTGWKPRFCMLPALSSTPAASSSARHFTVHPGTEGLAPAAGKDHGQRVVVGLDVVEHLCQGRAYFGVERVHGLRAVQSDMSHSPLLVYSTTAMTHIRWRCHRATTNNAVANTHAFGDGDVSRTARPDSSVRIMLVVN